MSENLDLDPFWWEAAPRRELPEAPLPVETDVAVVGSGFAGSSAALVLASRPKGNRSGKRPSWRGRFEPEWGHRQR